ncbi:MAG: hypothetical protein QOF19_3428 [Alphaproteobacteria bacterium]|jgi:uncharacterized BrkB/YihY/UPF0761 family membrane protein|nr:hypothetical protein [Alphaproteobacteria bacterium]
MSAALRAAPADAAATIHLDFFFHLIFLYAANFGSYNKTYGSLGAVVDFMLLLFAGYMISERLTFC